MKNTNAVLVACLAILAISAIGLSKGESAKFEETIDPQTIPEKSKSYPRVSPIHKMDVTVKKEQFDDFFDKLREFSNSNDFEFKMTVVHPNGERFSLGMQRADIWIAATNPFDVGEFRFGVYPVSGHTISIACLNVLLQDLKSLIGEVEGAIISEPAE